MSTTHKEASMRRTVTLGQHTVRVSFLFYDSRKAYWLMTLEGPNGSAAGVGPKPWPFTRSVYLRVAMPQWHFRYSYRLRRLGRWVYALSRANYRFYRWMEGRA